MRVFTADELDRMRSTQEDAMQDTCIVLTPVDRQDDWGNPVSGWTESEDTPCGYRPMSPREVQASGLVPEIVGQLRLAHDTVITSRCRVRLTKRFGGFLSSAETFEVTGPIQLGPSGMIVYLKRTADDA